MNRRSTDCLRPPFALALLLRSTQEEMDGRQCSSRNELESTCGRQLTRAAACCNKVFNTASASTCSYLFSVSGMFHGARVGRGGAIYQNVSPLVSANGRRPTPISRTTLAGRVPLSELRMQVTQRPTHRRRPGQKRVLRNLLPSDDGRRAAGRQCH